MSKPPKTRNGGTWTAARFRSFIVSNLRLASRKWGPKNECLKAAFVREGTNPKTGRNCKLHKCASCGGLFAKGDMRADHVDPVIDPEVGFVSWDIFIDRMFQEEGGYQAICDGCHQIKTAEERGVRTRAKRAAAGNVAVRKRRKKTN